MGTRGFAIIAATRVLGIATAVMHKKRLMNAPTGRDKIKASVSVAEESGSASQPFHIAPSTPALFRDSTSCPGRQGPYRS